MKYSSDFSTGIFEIMNDLNITKMPVSSRLYNLTENKHLSEEVVEYEIVGSGDIKPVRKLEYQVTTPGGTSLYYLGPADEGNPEYTVTESYEYNPQGDLVNTMDKGGRRSHNIYGYDRRFAIASVANANSKTDKPQYTSFETGENTEEGWGVTGTKTFSQPGVTGNRGFNLASGNSLKAAELNVNKIYKLSFWAKNPVAVSAGATLVTTSAHAVKGFTYYEYALPSGSTEVVITGTTVIDELRIYPSNARMVTSAYDELIGKTTECDDNNRITYYEYDDLARLQTIRDERGNIVKVMEYNIIGKPVSCPPIYFSKYVAEEIQRSTCSAGYAGSKVLYEVPADKYTSTISQEDADAKVDQEIQRLGQAYANANGSCLLVYYNTQKSRTIISESCGIGYEGGPVTYTVPAGEYSSLIGQAEADQMAVDELDANAILYANAPETRVCNVITTPEWIGVEGTGYCKNVNGALPAHLFIQLKDMNPNSVSYGQTQWFDAGPSSECSSNVYYSDAQSTVFIKNNCGVNGTSQGASIEYKVPAGKYTSTVSLVAANQLALDEINLNGQNYANQNAGCELEVTFTNWLDYDIYMEFENTVTLETYLVYIPAYTYSGNPLKLDMPVGDYRMRFTGPDTYLYYFNCMYDCHTMMPLIDWSLAEIWMPVEISRDGCNEFDNLIL